jgi:death on curing protein
MKLFIPDAETVVAINKKVCDEGGNPHHCFDVGKVDSAIHSAFYPGSYPFAHGGVAKLAGALAFYVCQAHAFEDGNKRTASLAAIVLLNASGFDIQYPMDETRDGFSDIIIGVASGQVNIDELKDWFDKHKIKV